MADMMLHGLLVQVEEENVYGVTDSNRRLGAVVKYYTGSDLRDRKRQWRAFGEDFDTLGEAVKAFLDIRGCKPRGPGGEAQ